MRGSRSTLSALLGLGVAVAGLQLVASPAAAVSPNLVITEVYGAGGNSGATHNADFVELRNLGASTISLAGIGIQYRSATGTGSGTAALTGDLAAGGRYLIQMSATGANGAALPTPDLVASPSFAMSASDGQVILLHTSTSALIDRIGYGDGATTFEGAPTGVDLTPTTSAQRIETEVDTDNNADDFVEVLPTPGAASPAERLSVAQVQGTGAASPEVGSTAVTEGVVTARYPTGGLAGVYLQTGGSPATPDASDAVFVYAPNLAAGAFPAIGTSIEVTGLVSEFNGLTEITIGPSVAPVTPALPTVTPLGVPWAQLDTDAEKEAHEGELLVPQGPFTVTDSYDIDNFGEIGLAAGTTPLRSPTDVADAQGTGDEAVAAENALRRITLDDGAALNFRDAANQDTPYPWLTPSTPVRVGVQAAFTGNVVLDYRNSLWKFQPTRRITGDGSSTATFANTREAAPEAVGGDIRLATFNVLNYFPTTGEEYVAAGLGTCTYFTDRDGARTTVQSCNPNGPRGAANAASFARQQSKTVTAINALDASIVSLEEIENSVYFNKPRDFALQNLVDALNADVGAGTWAFAPSPPAAELPPLAEQDVIRTAFIYKPADVALVGASDVLTGSAAFGNAREPLAQAFKAVGRPDAEGFAVIVNHFKSKGSGVDDGTGQGLANPDRIAQAEALSTFADEFSAARALEGVFLVGDFNAYTQEDPMQVLYDDGYDNLESTTDPNETSYSFDGLSGSLDHVVANEAAVDLVTGVDLWNINAEEAVAYEYSRYNSNATLLFDGTSPFKASDHNPEVVGLDLLGVGSKEIQVLGTNDFHGRLTNNTNAEAGAAVMAGAVKQLRQQKPNTVFAAAGDLIGASTFDSFIAEDKPTIDIFNEAGLDVSSVGNHEFDKGYDDLVNRVMAPYDPTTNPRGGAEWAYLGANVRKNVDNSHALAPTWTRTFGSVEVGFIGAVTEHLPELVSPAGISEIHVTDVVAEANAAANDLEAAGADVIVLLVHEGAPNTNCATMDDDPTSDFGSIITGVNVKIDAIVSGHTHLAYDCSFPVAGWSDRDVTERPVVSAGQYGTYLNQLLLTVDETTGDVTALSQDILNLEDCTAACDTATPTWSPNYPADPATAQIVADAVAAANVLGAVALGNIAGPFFRGKLANGTTENRGAESTLGNLVAEVQRWATETEEAGSAEIAFMNPGGLRADMVGGTTGSEPFPRVVTYRQAANVQSFANTLVNMQLTGANIKLALEQQWQPAGASRPFLRLGASKGFTYTFDASRPVGDRITGMWLDGVPNRVPIDPAQNYSVTVNSFLASGGDNFGAFNNGTQKRDTGKVDLEAMVDYLAEFADPVLGDPPLPVDYTQRAIGVDFPADAPAAYAPGDEVSFDVSSFAFTNAADAKDTEVVVSLDGTELGSFPLDNAPPAALPGFDDQGKASVTVTLPSDISTDTVELLLTGATTGTEVPVIIPIESAAATLDITAPTMTYGQSVVVTVDVSSDGPTPTGTVSIKDGGDVLGTATISSGQARITLPARSLQPGPHTLTAEYSGDANLDPVSEDFSLTVDRATPQLTVNVNPDRVVADKTRARVVVRVRAVGVNPVNGKVKIHVDGQGATTLTLDDGRAVRTLAKFANPGKKDVTVTFLATDLVKGGSEQVVINVKP